MSHDPFNAFIDLDPVATSGTGPMADVAVGVKSNIMVKGLPWTAGMGLYRNRIASRDAAVVARLRAAGAKVLGTLNMHEAALGATTDNAFYGRTHNPHRHSYTPGGSSGGSGAAVAAGLCDLALGTDTLGSIRVPAAYCGVYGLKPTNSAVSNHGLAFLEPDLDCIGPMAASLDMLERGWQAMSDAPSEEQAFKRVLMLEALGEVEVQPEVRAAYDRAMALFNLPAETLALFDPLSAIRLAGLVKAGHWLIAELGTEYHEDNPGLSGELQFTLAVCAKRVQQPDILSRTRDQLTAAISHDGILLTPTTPQAAFPHATRAPANQADFTALANVAGLPSLTLPAGWTDDGLPVGVMLTGPAGSEASLIALARHLDSRLQAYGTPSQQFP